MIITIIFYFIGLMLGDMIFFATHGHSIGSDLIKYLFKKLRAVVQW